jgi:hypothetical protein
MILFYIGSLINFFKYKKIFKLANIFLLKNIKPYETYII